MALDDLATAIQSAVKVHAVSDPPDYEQPWQRRGPSPSTGSGVILSTSRGPRVLTNAHCAEHNVFLEVRRHGDSRKFVAEVEGASHDADLALLSVEDPDFFADATPLQLGELPHLSDRVSACGFPIGGEHISVTEGVVSRIELAQYAQSQRELLAVQIDAAINAGNSGGPVIKDGKLVGLAFQAIDDAQNIGYMIALPVIEHFLRDIERGHGTGFPDIGLVTQTLQSRAHRRYLRLERDHVGVLVAGVVHEGPCWSHVFPGDVVLAVDGIEVAADGTVPFRSRQRINYCYLTSLKHIGEHAELELWRDGKSLSVTVTLDGPHDLVPDAVDASRPDYFLYGGVLFVRLTRAYLRSWGEEWWVRAPHRLVALYEDTIRTPARQEVIVLQRVLPDLLNQGYHDLENLVIVSVDGQPISRLTDLIERCDASAEGFISFESFTGVQLVLDRARVAGRTKHILERFGVPADRFLEQRSP